jgi:hypothetical protein
LQVADVLTRVARAVESVVPDVALEAFIGPDTLFEAEDDSPEEWGLCLGFYMTYRGQEFGHFEFSGTGPAADVVCGAVQQLLSNIQDLVSETTTEPWPLVLDGRRDMALGAAAIEPTPTRVVRFSPAATCSDATK